MARVRKSETEAPPVDASSLAGVVGRPPVDALVAAFEQADEEEAKAGARSFLFESAHRPAEKPIDRRMTKLVETVFAPKDWDGALARYDAWMSLGDKRTEEGFIRKAHEEGPGIVREIFDVYVQLRFEREAWELNNDVMLGAMRVEASKILEREKKTGVRTKMVTEADVATKCAQLFPDEWAEQEKRRLQFKLVEDRTKHCVEVGALRCRILDSMVQKLR